MQSQIMKAPVNPYNLSKLAEGGKEGRECKWRLPLKVHFRLFNEHFYGCVDRKLRTALV